MAGAGRPPQEAIALLCACWWRQYVGAANAASLLRILPAASVVPERKTLDDGAKRTPGTTSPLKGCSEYLHVYPATEVVNALSQAMLDTPDLCTAVPAVDCASRTSSGRRLHSISNICTQPPRFRSSFAHKAAKVPQDNANRTDCQPQGWQEISLAQSGFLEDVSAPVLA